MAYPTLPEPNTTMTKEQKETLNNVINRCVSSYSHRQFLFALAVVVCSIDSNKFTNLLAALADYDFNNPQVLGLNSSSVLGPNA